MRLTTAFMAFVTASSAQADIMPDAGYVIGDLTGDGRTMVASLFDNRDGYGVDLLIYAGDENSVPNADNEIAFAEGIGANGRVGEPNEYVTLTRAENGSLLLSYGPMKTARSTLTIAYRDSAFVVAGYTYVWNDGATVCDVNLLTGQGNVTTAGKTKTFTETDMKPLPISDWKELDLTLPAGCDL